MRNKDYRNKTRNDKYVILFLNLTFEININHDF